MLSFLPRRGTVAAVVAAVAVSLAFVVPVSAAATINRITETTTESFDIVDDCTGATGVLTGINVLDAQTVETSTGFHFEGTITGSGFVALNDGSYAILAGNEHLSFNTGYDATVFTNAHYDTVTVYSADGALLWTASFRLIEHFTVTSDGTVRAEFEIGHFRGGC
jgi:archaellin